MVPRSLLVATGVILLALVLGFGYAYMRISAERPIIGQSDVVKQKEQELKTFIEGGDFSKALDLLNSVPPQYETAPVKEYKKIARFNLGDDESQVRAVLDTIATYNENTGKPYEQMLAVNTLLGYINASFSGPVYDTVFNSDEFAKYKDKYAIDSVKNLAQHSYALSPSAPALMRLGQWHEDKINNVSHSWGLTEEEKKAHAQKIVELLDSAETIALKDAANLRGRSTDFMVLPRYYFWQVYLNASISAYFPERLKQAREYLTKLETISRTAKDNSGNPIALVRTRIPYAYYQYALGLDRLGTLSALEEAGKIVTALVGEVKNNPSLHAGAYGKVITQARTYDKKRLEQYYAGHLELAQNHKVYESFLKQFGGWNI